MKKLYFFLACFFALIFNLRAQVSVTSTTGGTVGYTTLKAAFDAVNLGTHQGSIDIVISGNTTETASAFLSKSGTGSASYTSIAIYPSATATIGGNIAAQLIVMNGAQNVTIDGRIGRTGSTRSLTFQNTNTGTISSVTTLRFTNGAANDIVQYVNLEGSERSAASGVLSFANVGAAHIENITISNNDIRTAGATLPYNAIYSIGVSTTVLNRNITIASNLIHDFFGVTVLSAGIRMANYNSAWNISGNSIYQTATRTVNANIQNLGMYITSGEGYTISGNYIGGSAVNAGGTAMTYAGNFNQAFYGMYLSVGTATASNIDGNTITNISVNNQAAASTGAFYGMYISTGKVNIGVNTGNTIGAATGTGAITVTANNTNNTFCTAIYHLGTLMDIRNNTIGSMTMNGSSTGVGILRGIETATATAMTVLYNTIGSATAGSMEVNTPSGYVYGMALFSSASNGTNAIANNTINNLRATGNTSTFANGVMHLATAINVLLTDSIAYNNISNLSCPSLSASSFISAIDLRYNNYAGTSIDGVIANNQLNSLSCPSTNANTDISVLNISSASSSYLTIRDNNIHGISAGGNYALTAGQAVVAIDCWKPMTGTLTITRNTIYDLENTASTTTTRVAGIFAYNSGANTTISKNKIYDLRNPNSPSGIIAGLYVNGSFNTGTFTLANNMITLNGADADVYGILNDSTATQMDVFYNSIYLSGTVSGSNSSGGFFRSGTSNNTAVNLKDNIVQNLRSGGTGFHYALMNNNTIPATGWTSNYNDLYTTDFTSTVLWNNLPDGLAGYQANSGQDLNSSAVAVTFFDASQGDLHVAGTSLGNYLLSGTPVSVTDDFDGNTRHASLTYMGADEALSPLPVTLTYFVANKQGETNLLKWKAESNTDNNNFVVERGAGQNAFTAIGQINASQMDCRQPFYFTDKKPLSGTNYYRLKMRDGNGKINLSGIVAITNKQAAFDIVSFNSANLQVNSANKTSLDLVITDLQGRLIQKTTRMLYEGSNLLQLDLGKLAAGIYHLTGITSDGHQKTIRFVKQ